MAAPGSQMVAWKTSLFGCTPSCDCIKTTLCPCWAYGNMVATMGSEKHGGCMQNCLLFLLCSPCCCACYFHKQKRQVLRETYNLNESFADDRLVTCCCAPCAICQEQRELDKRGGGGAAGGPVSQTMA